MRTGFVLALLGSVTFAGVAKAQDPAPAGDAPVDPAAAPAEGAPAPTEAAAAPADAAAPAEAAPATDAKPKPPPYSLPWQLRPIAPGNVARLDTSYGMYTVKSPAGDEKGSALVSMLLFSYKVMDDFAPLVRVGYLKNSPPSGVQADAGVFLNPVVGGLYGLKLSPEMKLGLFLGVALPVGQGGGERKDADKAKQYAALGAGVYTRAAMDNAMFAVNCLTVFPGVGFAYVGSGLTVQAEVTVLQLTRVKGSEENPATGTPWEPDKSRTNLTSGLHVGYFVIPELSLGAELRYQRWLSTPKAVEADEKLPKDQRAGIRDQASFAVGPRVHFKLGDKMWLRPGIAYARGIDKPMAGGDAGVTDYNIVQIDIPFVF